MTAIDKIRAHFDAIAPRKIEVPEWQMTIHATPLTISERNQIYSGISDADTHTALIRVIVVKARDAEGKPLFGRADEPALLNHADAGVVLRVASAILGSDAPNVDELGKS